MQNWIERKEYLAFLLKHKDKQIIKVISGIRRCGKSTLLEIFRAYLLTNGVEEKQILSLNLEDLQYQDKSYKELYQEISSRLVKDKMNYLLLDEIQNCPGFEKMVDSLFLQRNVDIYITGSNAYFMSGELATLLSGRYVELKMLPLSIKEYVSARSRANSLLSLYNDYITYSSFPYTLTYQQDSKAIQDYLNGLYSTILLKDVVQRYKITDVMLLESVIAFLFDSIGKRLSPNNISNVLNANGRKTNEKTIEKYIQALLDSLLFYQVKRYHLVGKQLLKTQSKYYAVDLGLRSYICGIKGKDLGQILENVVYLELQRRGYQIYVGQLADKEIDFVAKKANETQLIQVSYTIQGNTTYEREITPLKEAKNNYPKLILTMDETPQRDDNGIKIQYALDWLLE